MTILLAEDDPDDAEFFIDSIRAINKNYKVITCENGVACLSILDQILPDVVFIDINMPVMNGIECLLFIRKNEATENLPVVMYSTSITPKDVELFNKRNAKHLQKPSGYNDFVNTLRSQL